MVAVVASMVVTAIVAVIGLGGGSDPGADSNLLKPAGQTATQPNDQRPALAPRPLTGEPVLAGRVLDSAGAGVDGVSVTVSAERAAPNPSGGLVIGGAVVSSGTDGNGGFAFDSLDPGLYRIRIEGPTVVTAEVRFVQVPALELDITALRQIELGGRLVGQPSGAVMVVARGELGEQQSLANPDGGFVLSALPEGVYSVWAEGDGVGSKAVRVEARGLGRFEDIELTLVPTVAVRGQLRDRETGVSVVGDVIMTSDDGEPERRIATEPTGEYAALSLVPGRWTAQASSPGYVPSEQLAFEADRTRTLELLLSRGGEIKGVVVDPDGLPVVGAIVSASAGLRKTSNKTKPLAVTVPSSAPGTQFVARGELGVLLGPIPFPPAAPLSTARVAQPIDDSKPAGSVHEDRGDRITDASGQFRIAGLASATYRVLASHPDFAGGGAAGVVISLGKARSDVRIVLRRGVRITGTVRERGGSPIAGAVVGARLANVSPMRALTDDGGHYVLPPLIGALTLDVSAPGYAKHSSVVAVSKDGSEKQINIELERADKRLAGQVLDSSGFPVSGARVMIFGTGAGDTTDSAGRFEITGVARGAHKLDVRHPAFPPLAASVTAGDAIAVTLPIGGGISGHVRDDRSGESIALASLEARLGDTAIAVKSDERGDFKIAPIKAGQWTLTIVATGYARTTTKVMVAAARSPGELTARDTRIELSRGATVAGVVRDENGERVVGATVVVGALETTTDTDGRFRIVDVVARGATTIKVTRETRKGSEVIELSPGDERLSLDVRIN